MLRKARILLVDDSAQNRVLMRAFLEADGFEIVDATTGASALALAAASSYDLVVLDLMLPVMDGFAVLRELKRDARMRDMPVLVMSVLADEGARVRAIELGAADFLTRPASRAEVLVRVRGLIRQRILQERLDDSFFKLTSLVRTTEVHLAELAKTGELMSDPLPALVDHVRLAGKAGRSPEVIAAIEDTVLGPQGRVFRSDHEARPVPVDRDVPPFAAADAPGQVEAGVWNAGEPSESPWLRVFRRVLESDLQDVRNLAYCVGPGVALAAVNYPGGADAFDAEVIRGFALHWQFVRRVAASAREIEEAFEYTVGALARAAEAYDDAVGWHIQRVAEYSRELAEYVGLPRAFVRSIHLQSQMHDVGKIHVPLEILQKPAGLTEAENIILRTHTTEGARILGDHPRLEMAARIALSHHERWDGSGYPNAVGGESIPLEGRVVKLADVYDALRAKRPYKPALGHAAVVEMLVKGDFQIVPAHFDPSLLDAFVRIATRFGEIYDEMGGDTRRSA